MAVMRKASTIDSDNINQESEKLIQLIKENEGLRELLQISRHYGSLNTSGEDEQEITQIENIRTTDKGSDTDEEENNN